VSINNAVYISFNSDLMIKLQIQNILVTAASS